MQKSISWNTKCNFLINQLTTVLYEYIVYIEYEMYFGSSALQTFSQIVCKVFVFSMMCTFACECLQSLCTSNSNNKICTLLITLFFDFFPSYWNEKGFDLCSIDICFRQIYVKHLLFLNGKLKLPLAEIQLLNTGHFVEIYLDTKFIVSML